MKKISRLFILGFFIYGCAPVDSISSSPEVVPALPERPHSNSPDILRRDLLYKNDPRVSYCEIVENQNETYSGIRDTSLQPLASLSKVITSSWAIDQLGADYRFPSEIYFNPVAGSSGVFDVFLRTNFDPIINIEKLLYFISELKQAGVHKIRNLVIDESTRVFLGVLANPHIELASVPVSTNETIENLSLIFNSKNWGEKTKVARQNILAWAQKNNKSLSIPESFSVSTISFKAAKEIKLNAYKDKKVLLSAPLFKYLKNLNVFSNNYLADALFAQMGGVGAFEGFQKKKLALTSKELVIFTGSGLSDTVRGEREDNLGSCFSMIKVLSFFKRQAQKVNLNLGNLLLNPSADTDGTYDTPGDYRNAVVLKTGRLYDVAALNVAGFVSTDRGLMSFVYLGHDFTSTDANEIEVSRSEMLKDIYSNFSTQSTFTTIDYADIFF